MSDADTPGRHEDRYRLLKYDGRVGDAERYLLLAAAERLWDDLLFWTRRDHDASETELIRLLPPHFQHPAATDWQRWMLTFATVLWKLAQPAPPPPATMAEQILVAALIAYASDQGGDWHRDGLLDGEQPPDPQRLDGWLERYLDDADHELLYEPSLDGIDDEATDFQYGLDRMDYEGMFADFNELERQRRGSPHPLATPGMIEPEADEEEHVRRSVAELSTPVARAALAEQDTVRPGVIPPNPPVAAFRISQRLGVSLEWDGQAGLLRLRDFGDPDELTSWLQAHEGG